MSTPRDTLPVKLVLSMITSDKGLIREVLERAGDLWGRIDFLSERLTFHHTDYYIEEMGKGLFRKLSSFEKLFSPELLPSIKHQCKDLEDRYLNHYGKRRVNIDPGYIAQEKVVLATFKNFSHRIYIGKDVYADLTLIYEKGDFKPLKWTFPDYGSKEMLRVLRVVRERYVRQLKSESLRMDG